MRAIATTPTVARAITEAGGNYVLALKRNQPTLHAEVETYFADPATSGLEAVTTVEKDHGPLETRTTRVSHDVGWKRETTAIRVSTVSRLWLEHRPEMWFPAFGKSRCGTIP